MAGSFKKGAIPPDPRVVIPKIEDYIDVSSLAGGLPAAPGIIDRESKVKAWPMYANGPDPAAPPAIASTGVGDCTCAGIAHFLAAVTAFSGDVPGGVMFTDDAILGMYEAVGGYVLGNPATDNGCMLQAVCQYMVTTGLADMAGKVHKLAGYFAIGGYTNLELLKQVANTFGGVYLGVAVSDAADQQFSEGLPWTLRQGRRQRRPQRHRPLRRAPVQRVRRDRHRRRPDRHHLGHRAEDQPGLGGDQHRPGDRPDHGGLDRQERHLHQRPVAAQLITDSRNVKG